MNNFFLTARLGLFVWAFGLSGELLGAARPGSAVYRVPHPAEVDERLDDHERRIGYLETAGAGDVAEKPRPKEPSGTEPRGTAYRVQAGDTLYRVARRHGISVEALAAANRLSPEAKLSTGQVLRIPGQGGTGGGASRYGKALEPGEIRHTIRDGETLYALSRKYSVSTAELMRLNKISNAARLRPGTVLRVPSRGGGGANSEPVTDRAGRNEVDDLPEDWQWHVVRAGESLSQIAARYGVDRRALESANDLRGSSALQIGKRLKIPPAKKSGVAAHSGDPDRGKPGNADGAAVLGYFILKGDTVDSVAGRFGTDAETIRRLNGLGRTESLAPGRRIVVPNKGILEQVEIVE